MNIEVAMIITALINNVGKMDDINASARRTVKAVELLKKDWSEKDSLEEQQFNSIIEALKITYGITDLENELPRKTK